MAKRKKSTTVELKVRMKEPLRASIEKDAKMHGISMNANAVNRLSMSFHDQSLLTQVLGLTLGSRMAGITLVIGFAMAKAGRNMTIKDVKEFDEAGNWLDDPYAFDQAVQAVNLILEAFRPEGDIEIPNWPKRKVANKSKKIYENVLKNGGRMWAKDTLNFLFLKNKFSSQNYWTLPTLDLLGPLADLAKKRLKEFQNEG